ncbi:MAG: YjjG family noncanonical pyrimidine nucleotidase [Bacteroidaceae bacterium]
MVNESKTKYRHVFLDLDDTLWDTTTNLQESFEEVYLKLGYEEYYATFEDYYRVYEVRNVQLWEAYAREQIDKETLNKERFSYPLIEAGIAKDKAEAMGYAFSEVFFPIIASKKKLKPHAKELLDYLMPKYTLHILSNGFPGLQQQKMKSAGILDYFDQIILSENIGVPKPNKEIFDFALNAAQCQVEESIMIGDNPVADIQGANACGFDTIYYDWTHSHQMVTKPTYHIYDLLEIKKIL